MGKWGLRIELTCLGCRAPFSLRPGLTKRGRKFCSRACAASHRGERKTKRRHIDLTLDRLKELLSYDPETGLFEWRVTKIGKARAGARAGVVTDHGYVSIGVDGRRYYAHRLAWYYMKGEWPARLVDHKDLDGLNNTWDNLRLASKSQNGANSRLSKRNRSGLKGAYWDKSRRTWFSTIRVNGKTIGLGYFSSAEEAAAAFARESIKYRGEFARTGESDAERV